MQISSRSWTDHTAPEGSKERSGSIIDLVAKIKFNGNEQFAQQELGDTLGLTHTMEMGVDRPDKSQGRDGWLKKQGYEVTTRYDYRNAKGDTVHTVLRYEHPSKNKEFVQCNPKGFGIKGIKTILYRLDEWHDQAYVYLCEGEKDADNIAELEINSTCNPSGAGSWDDRYTEMLRDKQVVILEDNDDAGRKRTASIAWKIREAVKSLKIVRFPDLPDGGDVSDWLATGKTKSDLAIRSYFVHLRSQKGKGFDVKWKSRMLDYIEKYRMNIFADIKDILERNERKGIKGTAFSRYPEFEKKILRAHCESDEEYGRVIEHLKRSMAIANTDREVGMDIEDLLEDKIREHGLGDQDLVFLRSDLLQKWLPEILGVKPTGVSSALKTLISNGNCERLRVEQCSWPRRPNKEEGGTSRRGFTWINNSETSMILPEYGIGRCVDDGKTYKILPSGVFYRG